MYGNVMLEISKVPEGDIELKQGMKAALPEMVVGTFSSSTRKSFHALLQGRAAFKQLYPLLVRFAGTLQAVFGRNMTFDV